MGGTLRESVAAAMGISSAQAGKYQAIHHNLVPVLMARYKAGQIGTPVAYELSGLPKRQQEEIAATIPVPSLEEVRTAKAASKQDKQSGTRLNPTFSGAAIAAESQTAATPEQWAADNTTAAPVAPNSDSTTNAPGNIPAIPTGQSTPAPTMGVDIASGHDQTVYANPAESTDEELACHVRHCIDVAAGGTVWHNRLQAFFTTVYKTYLDAEEDV